MTLEFKNEPDKLSPVTKIAFAMQKASAHLLSHKNIMVAVSGGSDSDVMLDMLLRVVDREKLTFVFFDTGIEYAATKRHLDDIEKKYNITIDRQPAAKPVPLGCKQYGQPFLSKYASEMIERLQKYDFDFAGSGDKDFDELLQQYPHCTAALKWWCNKHNNANGGTRSAFNINRFFGLKEFMTKYPPQFKISNKCCRGAKKKTSEKYEKLHTFDCKCLGLRKAEGGIRAASIKSCFTRSAKGADISRPIFWFDDATKKEYTERYGVVYSDCCIVYGMTGTGCAGCPFGSNFENELIILREHESKLYVAVNNIFGDSYDYTRRYRQFAKKLKDGTLNQISIFDIKEGGGNENL